MARKIQLKNKSGEILHPETEVSAITDLVANPGGSGLTELTSLRIGNTSYRVAANPNMSGFATTEYVDNRMNAVLGTGEIAQAYDTVKEISDYITTHGSQYADIVNNLGTINSSIATLNNANLPSRVERLEQRIEWWMVPESGTFVNNEVGNDNPFKKIKIEPDNMHWSDVHYISRRITTYNGYDEPSAWFGIYLDLYVYSNNGSSSIVITGRELLDSNLLSQSELNRVEFNNLRVDNNSNIHFSINDVEFTIVSPELRVQDLPGYALAKQDILNSVSLPETHNNLSWYNNDAGFITSTALNGYALQANVPSALSDLNNDTGFITGSSLENYALESYVDNAIGNISIPSAVSDLTNDTGFITASSLSGLASESYVDNKFNSVPIPTLVSQLTNDMGYITSHQSLANYATKSYVDTAVGGITVPTKVSDLTNDAGYLTEHQSLTGLATESFVNTAIGNISIPTKTSDLTNDSGFLTQHQSLSGLATEQYVDNAIDEILGEGQISANFDTIKEVADYLTQHGSDYTDLVTAVQGKADASDIPTKVSDLQNDAGYLTSHQSLNGYATETYVNSAVGAITVPTKTSDLTNDSGFLTSHQSLSGYATESYVNSAVGGITVPTKVSDLTNDSAFITAASLPTKADYIYIVDYAHPNFAEATAAFNAGKVVLLKGAAPDANGYAVLNYVSNSYITFSKFLTSRSRNYASFNTYYLTSGNTWSTGSTVEGAREVVLNAVTGNPTLSGSEASLNSIKIGATSYKIPQPDLSNYALKSEVPEKVSDITNDTGFITASALQPYALAVDVPTKVSDLVNDSGFLTSHQDISGKQDVLTAGTGISINANNVISVSGIQGISYEVISEFPQAGAAGKIYLKSKGGRTKDVYEEYIWVNNDFELIGSTAIDLSGYAQTSSLATVATSGSYGDLSNTPSIPTATSDLDNDSGFITSSDLSDYATQSYVQNYVANNASGGGESAPEAFNIGSLVGLYNQNDNHGNYDHSKWTMKIFASDKDEKIDRHNIQVEVFDYSGNKVVLSTYVSFSKSSNLPVPAGTDWVSLASFYIQDEEGNYDNDPFYVYKGQTTHTWGLYSNIPTEEVYIIKHPVYGEFYWYSPLLIPNYTAGSGITISNGVISSSSSHVWTYEELAGHWPAEQPSGIYVDVNSDGTYAVFFPAGTFGLPSDTTATGTITLSGASLTLSNTQPATLSGALNGAEFALSIDNEGKFHMAHNQYGSYEKQIEPGIREKFGEPDLTQDGTYVLKATVSSGVVTYSWVLEA